MKWKWKKKYNKKNNLRKTCFIKKHFHVLNSGKKRWNFYVYTFSYCAFGFMTQKSKQNFFHKKNEIFIATNSIFVISIKHICHLYNLGISKYESHFAHFFFNVNGLFSNVKNEYFPHSNGNPFLIEYFLFPVKAKKKNKKSCNEWNNTNTND